MIAVKPIRTDADHADAVARLETLWGAPPGTPEGDALDVLATLVDAYEAGRWPEAPLDPIELLRQVMQDDGRSQSDLAALVGSRSRASEILSRKRALTVEMIWKISASWGIPADLLVRPYPLNRVA